MLPDQLYEDEYKYSTMMENGSKCCRPYPTGVPPQGLVNSLSLESNLRPHCDRHCIRKEPAYLQCSLQRPVRNSTESFSAPSRDFLEDSRFMALNHPELDWRTCQTDVRSIENPGCAFRDPLPIYGADSNPVTKTHPCCSIPSTDSRLSTRRGLANGYCNSRRIYPRNCQYGNDNVDSSLGSRHLYYEPKMHHSSSRYADFPSKQTCFNCCNDEADLTKSSIMHYGDEQDLRINSIECTGFCHKKPELRLPASGEYLNSSLENEYRLREKGQEKCYNSRKCCHDFRKDNIEPTKNIPYYCDIYVNPSSNSRYRNDNASDAIDTRSRLVKNKRYLPVNSDLYSAERNSWRNVKASHNSSVETSKDRKLINRNFSKSQWNEVRDRNKANPVRECFYQEGTHDKVETSSEERDGDLQDLENRDRYRILDQKQKVKKRNESNVMRNYGRRESSNEMQLADERRFPSYSFDSDDSENEVQNGELKLISNDTRKKSSCDKMTYNRCQDRRIFDVKTNKSTRHKPSITQVSRKDETMVYSVKLHQQKTNFVENHEDSQNAPSGDDDENQATSALCTQDVAKRNIARKMMRKSVPVIEKTLRRSRPKLTSVETQTFEPPVLKNYTEVTESSLQSSPNKSEANDAKMLTGMNFEPATKITSVAEDGYSQEPQYPDVQEYDNSDHLPVKAEIYPLVYKDVVQKAFNVFQELKCTMIAKGKWHGK